MRRSIAILSLIFTAATLSAQQPPAPAWNILVGAGAIAIPSYPGSDEHRIFPFPLAKVSYRDRAYFGPSSGGNGMALGAYALRTPSLGLAGEVGFLPDRPADRADALAGMEDRSFVATATANLSYNFGPLQGSVSATQGLNDDAGLLAAGQLSFTVPFSKKTIVVTGIGATLADARQMRWDFGVTGAEAARRQAMLDGGDTRLPADAGVAYSPDAGLRQVSASLTVIRIVSTHWAVIGIGGLDRLSDEAAASSLVRERMQLTGGLAVGYQF